MKEGEKEKLDEPQPKDDTIREYVPFLYIVVGIILLILMWVNISRGWTYGHCFTKVQREEKPNEFWLRVGGGGIVGCILVVWGIISLI